VQYCASTAVSLRIIKIFLALHWGAWVISIYLWVYITSTNAFIRKIYITLFYWPKTKQQKLIKKKYLVRHSRQTVCEQGSSLGVCSCPSYIPANNSKQNMLVLIRSSLCLSVLLPNWRDSNSRTIFILKSTYRY
jgi:hypothetical protein